MNPCYRRPVVLFVDRGRSYLLSLLRTSYVFSRIYETIFLNIAWCRATFVGQGEMHVKVCQDIDVFIGKVFIRK